MAAARPTVAAKPGKKAGEYVLQLPPGWELRLRRVLHQSLADSLPNIREPGLTADQREARIRLRRSRMQTAVCQYLAEVISADIVGKEVALATRNRFGTRRGSLREHVAAILKEVDSR